MVRPDIGIALIDLDHLIWPDVAPALTEKHTVVLADLRGYGESAKPAPDSGGFVYSRRSITSHQAGLIRQLGFGQFQPARAAVMKVSRCIGQGPGGA
ncbi:MAG TPA: hypothetical protein VF070_33320 [Streptosporangiaceae bacterium]